MNIETEKKVEVLSKLADVSTEVAKTKIMGLYKDIYF